MQFIRKVTIDATVSDCDGVQGFGPGEPCQLDVFLQWKLNLSSTSESAKTFASHPKTKIPANYKSLGSVGDLIEELVKEHTYGLKPEYTKPGTGVSMLQNLSRRRIKHQLKEYYWR